MKRIIIVIISLLFILFNLSSLSVAQETNLIRLGTVGAKTNPLYKSLEFFGKGIEKKFPGKYKIEIYPDAQLGSEKEMVQGILTGTMHGAVTGCGIMNVIGKSPILNGLQTPYLFQSVDAIYGIYNDFMGRGIMAPEYERLGFKLMACASMGVVQLGNSVRPVRKPDDLKAMKIRIWEDKLMLNILREMGANPSVMPYSDVLTALQSKQVDGLCITDMHIITDGFADVIKYCSDINILYPIFAIEVGLDWFNKQPKEVQQALIEIGRETTDFSYKMFKVNSKQFWKDLEAKGVKVDILTQAEHQKFFDKAQSTLEMGKQLAGKQIIDRILEARKKY